MAIVLKFHDEEFKRELLRATAEGLNAASIRFRDLCQQAVNKSNTHVKKSKRTRRIYYLNMHNAFAGQPPFLRTGHGRDQIIWESNSDPKDPRTRVGVTKNGIYMIYLELGTRRIRPRPWLLETLKKHAKMLGRLATMHFHK